MKIVTLGGATYDVLIQYAQAQTIHRQSAQHGDQSFVLLEEGKKTEVDDVVYKTGGGATNSAVSFVRLGFQATPVCCVGNDYQGQFIIKALEQEGVATKYISVTDHLGTSSSFVVSCPSGERSILVYRGASRLLCQQHLPHDLIEQADAVYITSLSGDAMALLPPTAQAAHQHSRFVAVNPGTNQLKTDAHLLQTSLPFIDVLIVNSFEATLFMHALVTTHTSNLQELAEQPNTCEQNTPCLLQKPITYQDIRFTLHQFFAMVHAQGPTIVVVTNGAEGVYVSTNNTIYFHPSIQLPGTKLVSTLGAGDAFGSCFVASLLHGTSTEDAIRCGIINSASVISYVDAKTGLLTKHELEKKLEQVDKNLLQKFVV